MSTFGDRLKQAREAKGVTLDSIAEATNISRRYLEALENGDLQILPGGAFNKGYIRTCAEFLCTDPQPILDAYNAEERRAGHGTPESEQQMLQELSRLVGKQLGKKRSRFSLFLSKGLGVGLTLTALVLVSIGIWLFLSTAQVEDVGMEPAPTTPSSSERRLEKPSLSVTPPERPESVEELEGTEGEANATSSPQSSSAGASSEIGQPETAPPPEPAERESPVASRLEVSGAAVGSAIVQRNLVGQSDRFPEGTRVFFWTRIVGGEEGEIVRHIWKHNERTVMLAELAIGGPHWRTYSSYTPPPGSAGVWVVEARGPDNRLLAREEFQCFQPPG